MMAVFSDGAHGEAAHRREDGLAEGEFIVKLRMSYSKLRMFYSKLRIFHSKLRMFYSKLRIFYSQLRMFL